MINQNQSASNYLIRYLINTGPEPRVELIQERVGIGMPMPRGGGGVQGHGKGTGTGSNVG